MQSAVRLLGSVGQAKGVTHVVGDPLDRVDLVVVRENDRVAGFLEREDFLLKRRQGCLLSAGRADRPEVRSLKFAWPWLQKFSASSMAPLKSSS